jgi:hypothetical protein
MNQRQFNKMVASNTLNANRMLLSDLERDGETNRILYITLKRECERIVKRYPGLA